METALQVSKRRWTVLFLSTASSASTPMRSRMVCANFHHLTGHYRPKAGRVLLTMRPRLSTKAVTAVQMSRKVLSDVWWPFVLADGHNVDQREKALVVWLNWTPALILLLGRREETQGPWVQFKKPTLKGLPVLDVLALDDALIAKLANIFDSVADRPILPFPKMATDPVRAEIDAAISATLGLPPLDELRELLSREPIFSLSMRGLTGQAD